jgi:hypothetical protein
MYEEYEDFISYSYKTENMSVQKSQNSFEEEWGHAGVSIKQKWNP